MLDKNGKVTLEQILRLKRAEIELQVGVPDQPRMGLRQSIRRRDRAFGS